jgi:hypothetical protein
VQDGVLLDGGFKALCVRLCFLAFLLLFCGYNLSALAAKIFDQLIETVIE